MRERGFGNLLGGFRASLDRVMGVWDRGGRRLFNSDKEFSLTMGADAESLKAGAGMGKGAGAGGRERSRFPGNIPK